MTRLQAPNPASYRVAAVNLAPKPTLIAGALVAVAALALTLVAAFSVPVDAQEVICTEVNYNERIILKCVSVDTVPGDGSVNTDAQPTPTPTAEAAGDDADDDEDSDDEDSDDEDSDDEDSDVDDDDEDADENRVDRGDRGSRSGQDQVDGLPERDSPEPDDLSTDQNINDQEDGPQSQDDEADSPVSGQDADADVVAGNDDGASGDGIDDGSDADDGSETAADFEFAPDPPRSNVPLIGTAIAFAGVGGLLYVAARRNRRSSHEP